jgi:hypothetical protein
MSSNNLFSASNSALGYLFQVRLALLESIRRIRSRSADGVCIEALDDISFESRGEASELLQTKHHSTPANLTDSSPDLWKTLRVWISFHLDSQTSFGEVSLYLITTSDAGENSIAWNLGLEHRDIESALGIMLRVARDTISDQNRPGADSFLALSESDQRSFVNSIFVLTSQSNILDVRTELKTELRISVREEHLDHFLNHVEGWWFHWCVDHLMSDPPITISLTALHKQIVSLAQQYEEENLPVNPWDEPDAVDSENDTRIFVQELREIGLTNRGIELAVRDYYRAFAHRSRWNREDLLLVGELKQYESKLVSEWEQHFEIMRSTLGENPSHELGQSRGLELYQSLGFGRHIPIRRKVSEEFIYRGSLHMLADDRRLGWHFTFKDRLQALLSEASS